ncbi:hypothetical protein ElyMa_003062000 [Elysia marginata]|uniref:Pacifastin domain-containing protein n=1 Tax=Elysia marginata TaxID=1093978 RepID=A0AAV4IEL2_9GAST|nr:hypothetical protein ElyMa_003062000 [Elysia marginata]
MIRWGSRWYGGGLRCHCDRNGAITCGDPQFVASRIDGFLMARTPCLEGEEWEEPNNCRYCECHVSGVALCWRAESCPYPFVIAPVIPLEDEDESSQNNNRDEDRNQLDTGYPRQDVRQDLSRSSVGLRQIENLPRHVAEPPPPPEEDLPGSGDDVNGMLVVDRPDHRPARPPPRPSSVGRTTVVVRQCKPGRRWRDRCKRCSCNIYGEKECTDRFCLSARVPSRPAPPRSPGAPAPGSAANVEIYRGRPIQKPPLNWSSQRQEPLPPIQPTPNTSCGEFQLNEVYFLDACNTCVCLPTGPMCTAVSC